MPRTITATIAVSTSPTSVVRGEWTGVSGVVVNTSSSKARIDINFSAVSNCDSTVYQIGSNTLRLNAGGSVLVTASFPVPPTACAGTYTITGTVEANGRTLDTDTATLTVTA